MIKRKQLEELYWGPSCMPDRWHTIEEVALATNLPSDYIKIALMGYGIPIRSDVEELHREVWKLLVDDFGMVFGSDFSYNTKLQIYDVDFFLPSEGIGIRVTDRLPARNTEVVSVGDSFLVKISSEGGADEMTQSLRKILLAYKVSPKHHTEDKAEEEW